MTSIEALINRQFLLWQRQQGTREESPEAPAPPPPIVTVSRQTGSRGSYFASRLALKLDFQRLHREVIDAITQSTGNRKRIIESLDEHYRSELAMLVEGVLSGQAIDNSDYVRHLCEVVLSMSRLGGVVLVGRGGNFILGPKRGLHIRFVCPRRKRISNLVTYKGLSPDQAATEIDRSDAMRREFAKKVFDADIDDPRHYDLVINANYIDVEELVDVAVAAYKGKMDKLAHLDDDRS